MRTSLPSSSSAYAIANCDPIESPSGRACDVTRKRCRDWIASQMRSRVGLLVIVFEAIVRGGRHRRAGALVGFRFQLLQDLFDAVLVRDRFVVEELELGRAAQADALADVMAQEGRGALQRPG